MGLSEVLIDITRIDGYRDTLRDRATRISREDFFSGNPHFYAHIPIGTGASRTELQEMVRAVGWGDKVTYLTGGDVVIKIGDETRILRAGTLDDFLNGMQLFPRSAQIVEARVMMPYPKDGNGYPDYSAMLAYVNRSGKFKQ